MLVGLTSDFRNPLRRPWRELWEDDIGLMVQVEDLGFDYVLVQEHFFTGDGYAPSIPVFLALLAERTSRIRIGSNLSILPLHHPAQLAQEMAVIDQFSGGRLEVTVGLGHRLAEYEALGIERSDGPGRLEEGIEVLRRCWGPDPVSFEGEHFALRDLGIQPKPLQGPHPPLWVGATRPKAAARAGRLGTHLRASSNDAAFYDAYAEGLAQSGIDPSTMRVARSWSITATHEDPEEVWRRNEALYFERWDFYRRVRAEAGIPALQAGGQDASSSYRDFEIIGSPDFLLEELDRLASQFPITDIVISGPAAGIPREEAAESLALFAEEVLPTVKTW